MDNSGLGLYQSMCCYPPDEADAQLHERQEADREHRVSVKIRQSRTTFNPK